MTEYIRCTALTRIVFGSDHWRVARAHADLAAAYYDLKGATVSQSCHFQHCKTVCVVAGYAPQAQQHAELARNIIRSAKMALTSSEKIQIYDVIISIHFTLGRALAQMKKYPLCICG